MDEETRTHQNCGVAMAKHYTQQVAASVNSLDEPARTHLSNVAGYSNLPVSNVVSISTWILLFSVVKTPIVRIQKYMSSQFEILKFSCFLEILKNRKFHFFFDYFLSKFSNFQIFQIFDFFFILKKVDGCLKIHRKSTWKSKNRFET